MYPQFALFQLTQALVYPDGTDPTEPDVPYTESARQVWYRGSDDAYGYTGDSPDTTLYHPTALRDAAAAPTGQATFHVGMRCHAWYNRQSSRWEIVAPALDIVRVELTATYMPGDTSVAAQFVDMPDEPAFTLYFPTAHPQGVGRAGAGSHGGTLAYAQYSPLRARFETLTGQFKLTAEGKADAAINTAATGTVSLWWKDYTTGNLVDSGRDITALNWTGPDIATGDNLIAAYDPHEDRWTITATG